MKQELQPKKYRRFEPTPIEANDTLDAVLDMAIKSLKAGRPPAYPETPEGLADFKKATIDYLQFVKDTNANPDLDKKLVPDVEGWANFTGLTRRTILTYEKQRSGEWSDFIAQTKNAIACAKKELAFHQQIPPIIAMFDLTNNHNYVNTSEFKIEAISNEPPKRILAMDELPVLDAGDIKNSGQQDTMTLPYLDDGEAGTVK